MIYGKGFHIMTAFGKAENCFVGFVNLWCSQGLGMNSLPLALLLMTSNTRHKIRPKIYFLHCSCLSLRNSVLQKTNMQGSSEQRVITGNLLLLCEKCFLILTTSGKSKAGCCEVQSIWWCYALHSQQLSSAVVDDISKLPSSLQCFWGFVSA